jgi:hypothetical protein
VSAIVSVPVRGPPAASTVNVAVPLPVPLDVVCMNESLATAVHEQMPELAVTVTLPVPPPGGKKSVVGATTKLHDVTVALAVLPVPPLVALTVPVVLFWTPPFTALTLSENEQVPLAGTVPFVRVIVVCAAVTVTVPPLQFPVSPFGLFTRNPDGNTSVNPTPVRASAVFGLVIVNVRLVV